MCLLLFLVVLCIGASTFAAPMESMRDGGETCRPEKLTVYKMVLDTFWTRDKFPKHYPDWRPAAQWSKVVG